MQFCSPNIYSPGGCLTFGVVVIGFIWSSLVQVRSYLNTSFAIDLKESLLPTTANTNIRSLSGQRQMMCRAIQISSFLEIAISGVFFSYLPPSCNYISYYTILGIRILAWGITFLNAKAISSRIDRGLHFHMLAALGWCLSQVISGGTNCFEIDLTTSNELSSYLLLVYFVLSCVALSITAVILWYSDQPKGNNQSDRGSIPTTIGPSFRPLIHSVSMSSEGSIDESLNIRDINSYWLNRHPSNSSAPAQDLVDVGLEDSKESIETAGADRREHDLGVSATKRSTRSILLSKPIAISSVTSNLREQLLSLSGEVTITVTDWYRVTMSGKSGTVYKLGLGESAVARTPDRDRNSGSRTQLREIEKRYDEIWYLREKLRSEFPHIDLPDVPTVPEGQEQVREGIVRKKTSRADYEGHKSAMGTFLEALISHPIAGKIAAKEFRYSVSSSPAGTPNSTGGSVRGSPGGGTGETLGANARLLGVGTMAGGVDGAGGSSGMSLAPADGLDTECGTAGGGGDMGTDVEPCSGEGMSVLFPLLIDCEGRLAAQVKAWTDVTISRKESKIFYEVEVRLSNGKIKERIGGVGLIYPTSEQECIWTVRKRYRQFRALAAGLERIGLLDNLHFPAKLTRRRPKTLDRETEIKLVESVINLDKFIKSCLLFRPFPPVLLAFLETDIYERSVGFDIVKTPNTPQAAAAAAVAAGSGGISTGPFDLMRTTGESWTGRLQQALQLEKIFDPASAKSSSSSSSSGSYKPMNRYVIKAAADQLCGGGSAGSVIDGERSFGREEKDDDDDIDVSVGVDVDDDDMLATGGDESAEGPDEPGASSRASMTGSLRGSVVSTKRSSIFSFGSGGGSMSGGSRASVTGSGSSRARGSTTSMTQDQLMALPAMLLEDLICLLQMVRASDLASTLDALAPPRSTSVAPLPSTDLQGHSTNYLTGLEFLALNSVAKYKAQAESEIVAAGSSASASSAATSTQAVPTGCPFGCWLPQFRVRRALLSTTAFREICAAAASLRKLNLKATVTQMKNDDRVTFCLNLYNLMALHASVLLPWPRQGDRTGRVHWLRNARYEFAGGATLSLLQLEFGILRSRIPNLPVPTLQHTDVPYPTNADLKAFAAIFPSSSDPRIPFALCGPFRSSCYARVFYPQDVQLQLFECTVTYLSTHVSVSAMRSSVIIPRTIRLYRFHFENWVQNADEQERSLALIEARRQQLMQQQLQQLEAGSTATASTTAAVSGGVGSLARDRISSKESPSKRGSMRLSPVGGTGPMATGLTATALSAAGAAGSVGSIRLSRRGLNFGVDGSDGSAGSDLIVAARAGSVDSEGDKETEWDIVGLKQQEAESFTVTASSTQRTLTTQRILQLKTTCIGEELLQLEDCALSETELLRLLMLLKVGLDVRDRKYRFHTYKDCFLGCDAVKCFLASGDAKTTQQSIAICNELILYGYIKHVVGDHWMKDQELFFEFTRYEPPRPHLTLLRAFVEDHLQDPETRRQLRKSLQNNDALVFSPAENAFAFPVSRDVTWQAV